VFVASFWHGRPWRVNPPRVAIVCAICRRTVMRQQSDIRPGQVTTSCSSACKALAMMLWPLKDRAAFAFDNALDGRWSGRSGAEGEADVTRPA